MLLMIADDILHVRLQTLGVTEHSFDIDIGGVLFNWLLYDVGGAVRILSTHFIHCCDTHALVVSARPGKWITLTGT